MSHITFKQHPGDLLVVDKNKPNLVRLKLDSFELKLERPVKYLRTGHKSKYVNIPANF